MIDEAQLLNKENLDALITTLDLDLPIKNKHRLTHEFDFVSWGIRLIPKPIDVDHYMSLQPENTMDLIAKLFVNLGLYHGRESDANIHDWKN